MVPGTAASAASRAVAVPKPLSDADVHAYQKVFSHQEKADWAAADAELAKLNNDLLKGHVLAERYLSSSYTPKYQDLVAWMDLYADLPQAEAIYALATSKAVRGVGRIKPPVLGSLKGSGVDASDDDAAWETAAFSSRQGSAAARAAKARLRGALTQERFRLAEDMLAKNDLNMAQEDADEVKAMAAAVAYYTGHDDRAIQWSTEVAQRSGEQIPAVHWIAGLALWRSGKPELARSHFEAVANSETASSWLVSAGAFWAGRANLVARRPEAVNHWMEIAASYPRTFYGLLARQTLGYDTLFAWDVPAFTQADAITLGRVPGVNRALALIQLNRNNAAEDELRKVYPRATKAVRQSLVALSQTKDVKLPGLALRLGGVDQSVSDDVSAFPVPSWSPAGGWNIDRALVYAIARQESRFNTNAGSRAGARGLMQLMPATARALGGDPSRLHEPSHNLSLGQKYLHKLLAEPSVNGNLIFMAAAYNAGPGNLVKWLSTVQYNDDPLLFVESIPARETRSFVEKVLTNFWIYSARVGSSSPSLEAVATGAWPMYEKGKPL